MKVKAKRVVINPEMLISILEGGTAWRVTTGVPKGARLRGFTLDPYTQALHMFVEHESYEPVLISEVFPQQEIFFKKLQ